ncbi:hypothetical protein V12B01_13130 [Vibrio splendidus 12B01]|nr:hypothetical protein V12B01_13130 [Vibrio splendidus 12B01]
MTTFKSGILTTTILLVRLFNIMATDSPHRWTIGVQIRSIIIGIGHLKVLVTS